MKAFLISVILLVLSSFAASVFAQDSNAPRTYQATEVTTFVPPGDTPVSHGAAWLKRSLNGVEGRVQVNVEMAGFPYTVWWVIFNKPEACDDTDPPVLDVEGNIASHCDGGDFVAAEASIFHASGAIAADNNMGGGVINVDVSTIAGELPAGIFNPWKEGVLDPSGPAGVGLQWENGFCADVHMLVDSHFSLDMKANTTDWVLELTRPEATHRALVFPAVQSRD